MSKLKMFAAATAATAAVGLTAAPVASAQPMTCSVALSLSQAYIATGDIFYALGNYSLASRYYGRAQGVVEAAC
jgi:hypothetical protein